MEITAGNAFQMFLADKSDTAIQHASRNMNVNASEKFIYDLVRWFSLGFITIFLDYTSGFNFV